MMKSDASGSIQFPDDPIPFPSAEDDVIKGFPFSGVSLCMTSSSSRLKPFIISKSSESFLMRSNLLSSISFFILRNLCVSRERVQILIILGQSLRLTRKRWTLALLRYWGGLGVVAILTPSPSLSKYQQWRQDSCRELKWKPFTAICAQC